MFFIHNDSTLGFNNLISSFSWLFFFGAWPIVALALSRKQMGIVRLAGMQVNVYYNVMHTQAFQYPAEVLIHFHKTIRLEKLVFIIAQSAATVLLVIDISKRVDKMS